MNRSILIPRRNPASVRRFARMLGKYRYYRSIGVGIFESVAWAWRAVR